MKRKTPCRHYERLSKNNQNFRRLTGITVEKFEEIYEKLEFPDFVKKNKH